MFCPGCGKEIPDNSTYCSFCGQALHVTAQPPQAATPPATRVPAKAVATASQSISLGIGLMVLGMLFILGALGAQSYCSGIFNGCYGLIYPNANSLYVVEGLGALVFVVGLVVLIRKYVI